MEELVQKVADLICQSKRVIVFTGAGVSDVVIHASAG